MSAHAHQPDLDLLARFQSGDAAAFSQIVSDYGAMVFTACVRITRDKHRAEDLAQETFFKLSQRPHEVTRSLGAWLHKVATRLAIDALRREGTRSTYELAAARHSELVREHAQGDGPSWAEVGPRLDAALAELPEASRDIIVRHFLMQQSQRQIAQDTGMSQPTVSRRINVALDQLRKRLGQSGVIAGAAALSGMLASAPAHAAPASVGSSAGGMSLLTQATGISAPAAWGPLALKAAAIAVPVLGLSVGAVLIISGLAQSMDQASGPTRAQDQQRLIEEESEHGPQKQQTRGDLHLIFEVPERQAFSTTWISGATLPPAGSDAQAQLVYADSHVVSVPRDEAVHRIEQQTGLTIQQVQQRAATQPGAQP